jgi:aminoglycoside 6'-N-acetyltransferase I
MRLSVSRFIVVSHVVTDAGLSQGRVHYVHPDKPPELWINEVGVAPTHRRLGIGRRLLDALFERGRSLGCRQAWVAIEPVKVAARRLSAAAGGKESPEPFVMVEFELGPKEPP